MKSASDVLQVLFENGKSPLANQFLRWKIWKRWPEIVGETTAAHTVPVGYDKGTLYIWVKSSSWMQQMVYFAQPVKEKINKFIGKNWVRRVRFTLDKKGVPNHEENDSAMFREFIDKFNDKE